MVALYDSLLSNGLGSHMAWRLAFVVVPVPFLLTLAVAILVFGTDHPAGKWSDRHKVIVHYVSDAEPNRVTVDEKGTSDEACDDCHKQDKYPNTRVTVSPAQGSVRLRLRLSHAHKIDVCNHGFRDHLCRERITDVETPMEGHHYISYMASSVGLPHDFWI